MTYRILPLAAAIAFAILPAPAAAQARNNPDALMGALRAQGFTITRLPDVDAHPTMRLMVDGRAHEIMMYNCKVGVACMSFSIVATYQMTNQPTLAKINEWNQTKRFVRARLDSSGRPGIAVDVSLNAPGGMSDALIVDNVKWFLAMQSAFKTFIGFAG